MKKVNSAISLLTAIGGDCMRMTFGKAMRSAVDSMTPPKERKDSRKLAGGYGWLLRAKFDLMRGQAGREKKQLAYANKRG